MITPLHIVKFVAAADYLSFRVAEKSLGYSSKNSCGTTVSRAVYEIEELIGYKLFIVGRHIYLTQEGLALYELCKDAAHNIVSLTSEINIKGINK